MNSAILYLWLIPALPLLAAGILALTKQPHRSFAASVAILAMGASFGLSLFAFGATLQPHHEEASRAVYNFPWLQFGETAAATLRIGWVIDPLAASVLVMVTLVGSLVV